MADEIRQLWITFRFRNLSRVTLTPERIKQMFPGIEPKKVAGGFGFRVKPNEQLQALMEEAWREIAKTDGVLSEITVWEGSR